MLWSDETKVDFYVPNIVYGGNTPSHGEIWGWQPHALVMLLRNVS